MKVLAMQAQGAPPQDITAALVTGVEACPSNTDLHRKRFDYALQIDDTLAMNELGLAYCYGEHKSYGLATIPLSSS